MCIKIGIKKIMNHKKITLLLALMSMAAPVVAKAPRAETFDAVKQIFTTDLYMRKDKSLPSNASKEQLDAAGEIRSNNTLALIKIFTHNLLPAKKRTPVEMIFPTSLLVDANFFSAEKEHTVFSRIDESLTQAGQVVLAATLAEGTNDLAVLERRAEMIRELAAHEELRFSLAKTFKNYAKHEKELLTAWSSTEGTNLRKILAENTEKTGKAASAWRKVRNVMLHATKTVPALTLVVAAVFARDLGGYTKQRNVLLATLAANAAGATKLICDWANARINKNIAHSELVERSIKGFNALVETVNTLEATLLENVKKASLPESFTTIAEQKASVAQLVTDLNALVKNGSSMAAARMLLASENTARISALISFVGEIDAYLAMATHYDKHRKAGKNFRTVNSDSEGIVVDFCTFNTTSQTPYIKAEGYWNPIIKDISTTRTSSIELGGDGQARDAIITGPNAGGKSIALRGLINQLILSHSYHMAWARKFETTLFKLVIGELNNIDDPTKGQSKLVTEVLTMNEIIDKVSMLDRSKREFAFIVTDELMTGTEPKPAVGISFEMCEVFAELDNVMYILATHYTELTSLEKTTNGIFKNYCVKAYITKGDNGVNQVTYPYKLFSGVGSVNVALDIMLLQMHNRDMTNNRFYPKLCELQARNEAAGEPGVTA
jgi:hypothetical protein